MSRKKGFTLISKACVRERAFTLIEILVVISIFAVIGFVASQAVVTTLRGSRKADTQAKLRQNIDYALGIIQRNLYNGDNVVCNPSDNSRIDFLNTDGTAEWIGLVTSGSDQYIAQTQTDNRLTSDEISVTQLTFNCTPGSGNASPVIDITVVATDPLVTGPEAATITTASKVVLRRNI